MIICAAVILFVTVVVSGPDGADWLARRRERRDQVTARVTYLPSAVCRAEGLPGRCYWDTCAICRPARS